MANRLLNPKAPERRGSSARAADMFLIAQTVNSWRVSLLVGWVRLHGKPRWASNKVDMLAVDRFLVPADERTRM
jgi:hypothetical protein